MSRWQGKYVIGLTGNIAVGKSVVRQMLQHLGAYTIDADSLAHQAMMPGAPAYKPVVSAFGQMVVGQDGRINRATLGSIVFSNPQAMQKLEEITHPIIRQAIQALVTRAKQRVIVVEAIKLLESPLAESMDAIWVVNASPKAQYRRLIEKRKMSEADAKQRILAQTKQADKITRADVVIENEGNVEQTWKQVQVQWLNIKKQLTSAPDAPADEPDTSAPTATSLEGITAVRGNPSNAPAIAQFIQNATGQDISKTDVLMKFGEKSFLFCQDKDQQMIALMGWTVENLVTRMDEFYLSKSVPMQSAVNAIVTAVEDASNELQSEVCFIFLPKSTPADVLAALQTSGYKPTALNEIKIPAWREAVEEGLSGGENQVLWKQLRDRVLQPI